MASAIIFEYKKEDVVLLPMRILFTDTKCVDVSSLFLKMYFPNTGNVLQKNCHRYQALIVYERRTFH